MDRSENRSLERTNSQWQEKYDEDLRNEVAREKELEKEIKELKKKRTLNENNQEIPPDQTSLKSNKSSVDIIEYGQLKLSMISTYLLTR